jgi:hypothetical protein
MPVVRLPPLVRAAQRLAPRLCFVVARWGAYCFGGGGNGSRAGSGLILARIALGDVGLMIEGIGGSRRPQRVGADFKAELR